MGRQVFLGCAKEEVRNILAALRPELIPVDRTRKASLASQVIFDDQNLGEEIPQGAGAEFEEAKPLAEELIDTLIDMLFFADFTLPRTANAKSKVTYAIWQSGVGCNTAIGTSKEFESNRCEILRLILTLTSKVFTRRNSNITS